MRIRKRLFLNFIYQGSIFFLPTRPVGQVVEIFSLVLTPVELVLKSGILKTA